MVTRRGAIWTDTGPRPLHMRPDRDALVLYYDPSDDVHKCPFCYGWVSHVRLHGGIMYSAQPALSFDSDWMRVQVYGVTRVRHLPCRHEIDPFTPDWSRRYTWPMLPAEMIWPVPPEYWARLRDTPRPAWIDVDPGDSSAMSPPHIRR